MSVKDDYLNKKKEFEVAFKKYYTEVFLSKVLDQNKSPAQKNNESQIIQDVVNKAIALDNINDREGMVALFIAAIRGSLRLRDRVNDLEYKIVGMQNQIDVLLKDLGVGNGKKDK